MNQILHEGSSIKFTNRHAHNLPDCPNLAWDWGTAQSVIQCANERVQCTRLLWSKQTIKQNSVFYTCLRVLRHVQTRLYEKGEKYTKTISNRFIWLLYRSFNLLDYRFASFLLWQQHQPWTTANTNRLTTMTCRRGKKAPGCFLFPSVFSCNKGGIV